MQRIIMQMSVPMYVHLVDRLYIERLMLTLLLQVLLAWVLSNVSLVAFLSEISTEYL